MTQAIAPPTAPAPKLPRSRAAVAFAWLAHLLFLLMFYLPAVCYVDESCELPALFVMIGWAGLTGFMPQWLANVAFVLASFLWFKRLEGDAAYTSAIGFVLALSSLLLDKIPYPRGDREVSYFASGYYVWLASLLCVFVASTIVYLQRRNSTRK
jgi:hypothetical protein